MRSTPDATGSVATYDAAWSGSIHFPVSVVCASTTPNGTTNRQLGVAFISDTRLPSTFAHEAGHFVGDMGHDGTDIKLLMRGDGSGYKIPFELAKRFRESFARRPAP